MHVSPMVTRIDEMVQDFNNGSSIEDLVRKTGLPMDMVRRCMDVMKNAGKIPNRRSKSGQ